MIKRNRNLKKITNFTTKDGNFNGFENLFDCWLNEH